MPNKPETQILLVDDDPAKRYTIAKTLTRAGFEVREAGTGCEALRLVASLPDLVVLDVKLPDMDGFEVCRRIKSDPATSAIPVLHISTTFVDIEDKVHGLDSGADGYLTNVAEPMELIATVRALLRARKAEDAAQLSKRQWQTTFDAISDGVLLLDSSGKVVQTNRTAELILGQPWIEIVGRNLPELWNEPTEPDVSLFARMLNSGERESRDLARGDHWLHVAIDPLRNGGNAINGALCLVSDITNRKRMEMQLLRQAEKLHQDGQRKDEFLAMLAHELRNPLAPLANALQIIGSQVRGNSLIDESLDIARRQIHHMARLLDDLFDISRITRGKIELKKSRVDFNAIAAHAVEAARPLTEALRHELAVVLSPEPLVVEGDSTRLEQVVSNLLNNAAKYTEPGGRITLTLRREDQSAVLQLQDSGVGITPEMQQRIFDLFVQADHSLDRARGGLGIGLTLVRRLVEFHHGTISVFSDGPGQGSEFLVRIPLAGPTTLTETVHPSPRDESGRHLRILIVDDNKDSARTMAKILEIDGHQVSCTFDGPSVIAHVAAERPEVVLLDIGVPGIDGYNVAQQLRQLYTRDELMLIAMTGYGGDLNHARAQHAGFDHFLVKPVNLSSLKQKLSSR
jgi:PAS domain S-box-containing protein